MRIDRSLIDLRVAAVRTFSSDFPLPLAPLFLGVARSWVSLDSRRNEIAKRGDLSRKQPSLRSVPFCSEKASEMSGKVQLKMNSQIESVLEESQEPLTAGAESVHSRESEGAGGGKIRQFNVNRRVTQQLRWGRNPDKLLTLICSALALMIALTIAPTALLAGGGNVLPGPAKPKGFSLSDMARATAFFNTGPRETLDTYPIPPFKSSTCRIAPRPTRSQSVQAQCSTCRSSLVMTRRPSSGTFLMLITGKPS
jgi:hypothetical protein